MNERDVLQQTHHYLTTQGLLGMPVLELYTDAHPTLLDTPALRPFQRFTLAFDGFAVHPDLVGRLRDGETTFAIEAKGDTDLLKGIAQAEIYRHGFHLVLLACMGTLSRDLVTLARQRQVGVLAVYPDRVNLIDMPPPHLPELRHARHIRSQLQAIETLTRSFTFNMPTHYLCFAPIMRMWEHAGYGAAPLSALEAFTREQYPVLPIGSTSFRSALSGAAKLSLVQIQGQQVRQTFLGRAIADLVPDPTILTMLHRQLTKRGTNQTLASLSPTTGAVLRSLLNADPIARFIIDTLTMIGRGQAISMPTLIVAAAERDKALATLVFFNPETAAHITDDQGQLIWRLIQPQHYRSTTFMQYKSILKHAGAIAPHPLGGSSTKHYDPHRDLWELL